MGLRGVLVGLLAAGAAARDTVSFDFGWKHRPGLHDWADPTQPPPENPDPGPNPAEAAPSYDDKSWENVGLPHDGLIGFNFSATACPDGCSGRSYIPRAVLWYRKTFTIPADWAGSSIWLNFEGSFRETTVWVNGVLSQTHVCGYTPFQLRLDNISAVKIGEPTVVAVFVDPDNGDSGGRDHGSGWWYEGGGLYRHVNLIRADPVHVEEDGMFARSNLTFSGSKPLAVLHTKVDLVNDGDSAATVCVSFNLTAPDGNSQGLASSTAITIPAGQAGTSTAEISVSAPLLWSSSNPNLYTVGATVHKDSCTGDVLDQVEVVHGFRDLHFDANDGFFLNKEHFKVRGFCDHASFGVVGMAVPDRINLFRAQASRGVGGNGRRTSHNPPDPTILSIYDRIGIVVMDENRLFDNNTDYVHNMGTLVKRDRNHPSVVIWSFCNEGDCEGNHEQGGPAFQAIVEKYDGTRPTLANMFTFNDLLSNTIDVQGFSHQSREKLETCHAALPHKPIFMSECCSCNTMRDEDVGRETTRDNPHYPQIQESFNARCAESNTATNASDGVNYAVGTMVWTLFDYYGEPPVGGLEVSSTYGQYDLVGFPKAAAFWYRVQWLLTIKDNPDKTFPTNNAVEVHLVESWESPDSFPSTRGNTTRDVHAYSNAPEIELFVNGKSQGSRSVIPMRQGPGSYAEWLAVPWEAGELKAVAKDSNGKALATTARNTNRKATKLGLTIDAPSISTGTGTSVLLDGHDVALLRASILDSDGNVKHLATNNVSFRVVSGPGQVQGCGNGDPHAHQPNNVPWHTAYHGLVRAVIRVASVAARPARERAILSTIDAHGPMAAANAASHMDGAGEPIIVEASSPGFTPVQVSIPTSTDATVDGVFAAAEAAAGKPVNFFASG